MSKSFVTKNKLLIIAMSLSIVVILSLIATVIVLASTVPKLQSSINVKYTVSGVFGKASATYTVGSSSPVAMKNSSNLQELDLQGSDLALSPSGTITLTKDNNYVVFAYKFVNTGENAFYVIPSYQDVGNADTNVTTYYLENSPNNYTNASDASYLTIAGNSEDTYYIRVEITDLTKAAVFSGTITWTVTDQK